ncbi:MAG: hypothetical protein ACIAQF_12645 [Phycisphaerales bacterium JB065]
MSTHQLLHTLVALACASAASLLPACERAAEEPAPEAQTAAEEQLPQPVICHAELRSFIVAGKGRHLYLLIDCPEGHDEFDGRVEFTSASMRSDYSPDDDRTGTPRVAKMSAGRPLFPIIENADDRLEAEFEITLDQAICLQQDRIFSAPYALVGTNSSSGLRRAMEECDCDLPSRILNAGGVFGDFPGIDKDPGRLLDRHLWPAFGLTGEPEIHHPDDQPTPAEPVG